MNRRIRNGLSAIAFVGLLATGGGLSGAHAAEGEAATNDRAINFVWKEGSEKFFTFNPAREGQPFKFRLSCTLGNLDEQGNLTVLDATQELDVDLAYGKPSSTTIKVPAAQEIGGVKYSNVVAVDCYRAWNDDPGYPRDISSSFSGNYKDNEPYNISITQIVNADFQFAQDGELHPDGNVPRVKIGFEVSGPHARDNGILKAKNRKPAINTYDFVDKAVHHANMECTADAHMINRVSRGVRPAALYNHYTGDFNTLQMFAHFEDTNGIQDATGRYQLSVEGDDETRLGRNAAFQRSRGDSRTADGEAGCRLRHRGHGCFARERQVHLHQGRGPLRRGRQPGRQRNLCEG